MRRLSARASFTLLWWMRTDNGVDWLKEATNHNGHSRESMAKCSIQIITFDYFKILLNHCPTTNSNDQANNLYNTMCFET